MSTVASSPLRSALVTGTILQLVMVIGGHFSPAIAALFAIAGMLISLVAGALYGVWSGATRGQAGIGGALVGGGCALLGIAVSVALGDVTWSVLLFGTASSAATGGLGGWLASLLGMRRNALA